MSDESDLFFKLEDLDIKETDASIFEEIPKVETEKQEDTAKADDALNEDVQVEIPETIEKEEVKAEEKTEDGTPPDNKTDDSSQSTLYALAKHLKDQGVLYLQEDIDKVESLEDLEDLIKKSNEQAKYVNLTDSQKRYQDALEAGIPKKEYENIEKELQAFTNVTAEQIKESEQLRYEINALDLMDKGVPQEQALKLAKLALTDETNVEDTQKALEGLIENKKAKFKLAVEESSKKTEVKLDEIKKNIDDKKELLEMPLNEITKNKLFDLMTTKVGTDDEGNPLNKFQAWQKENPIESNIFINYMYLMTNEGKDLGLIKKTTNSSAAKELEKKLKSMNFDENGSLIIPDNMLKGNKSKGSTTFTDNKFEINI